MLTQAQRQKSQQKRQKRWNSGERPCCKAHPTRLANKSGWISSGNLRCASCQILKRNGTFKDAYVRYHATLDVHKSRPARRERRRQQLAQDWGGTRNANSNSH